MKFVILLFSVLIFSGCATHEFSKSVYSNNPSYQWSGGILHYGQGKKYDDEGISELITNFCQDRPFKKVSIENALDITWVFWPIGYVKEYKLEFECINEKKRP